MPTPAVEFAGRSGRRAVREARGNFVDDNAVAEVFALLEGRAKAPQHRLRASHVHIATELYRKKQSRASRKNRKFEKKKVKGKKEGDTQM